MKLRDDKFSPYPSRTKKSRACPRIHFDLISKLKMGNLLEEHFLTESQVAHKVIKHTEPGKRFVNTSVS